MITVEAIKNYNPDLALYNKILDSLKSTYKFHKTVNQNKNSGKSPLELLVIVNGEREYIYKHAQEIYDQALQALVDLVNSEAI